MLTKRARICHSALQTSSLTTNMRHGGALPLLLRTSQGRNRPNIRIKQKYAPFLPTQSPHACYSVSLYSDTLLEFT
jgi:hypothetical protein